MVFSETFLITREFWRIKLPQAQNYRLVEKMIKDTKQKLTIAM
jgi:hypothetical protein